MNLILFAADELEQPLPTADRRAQHLLRVLRRGVGDTFDVGLINGPRGKATVTAIEPAALRLSFAWGDAPPAADPVTLIIGLPRPQTARDILRDATSLGVGTLHFVACEKAESSYAQSSLWHSGEWRRQLVSGAEQAFDTRIPAVTHGRSLGDILAHLEVSNTRIALDNYEASLPLGDWPMAADQPIVLAIGPERGWSEGERDLLRTRCFGLAHLGPRVLRTETAVIAALAIVRAHFGWMR